MPVVIAAGIAITNAPATAAVMAPVGGGSGGVTVPAGAHVTQQGTDGSGLVGAGSTSGGIHPDTVPANWCSAGFEGWDTTGPDTANAMSTGSCNGPIASIATNASLFAANGSENVANASDYQENTSFSGTVATDYCDNDPGGCYADNPFSDWVGQTFYTRQGWSGGLDNCSTAGDYMYCSNYPGGWDWP
jgi:hypothetical protein